MRLWLGTLRQWHWISSALCRLACCSSRSRASPSTTPARSKANRRCKAALQLPESLLAKLQTETPESGLPVELRAWLEQTLDIRTAGREAEWSDGELYVALPRPGGDARLSLSSETGELEYESTDRGWIAYFNDLHKGRHTGEAWAGSSTSSPLPVWCSASPACCSCNVTPAIGPAPAAGRPGAGDTAAALLFIHGTAHA